MNGLPFYIGTHTNVPHAGAPSEGIYRAILGAESGQLSDLKLVATVKNPTFLAFGRGGRHLYAVCDIEGSAVGAWEIEASGNLRFINHQPTGGAGACHLSVDGSGRNVLVANYGGGSVASFPLSDAGAVGACRSLMQHRGSGPNAARQEKPHAHSVYCDEANHFVYACDLGTDEVLIYNFDPESGALSPADPSSARVPAGGGPRHLALDARGFAHVNNELGLSITSFARDLNSGALTVIETVPTLAGAAVKSGVSTSEIALHPGGNWLYVSTRGHESIAVFRISPNGNLSLSEHVEVPDEPRGFGVSPDGRWLVVGGQKAHQLAAFQIDETTGKLTPCGQNLEISAPVCVVFAG